MKTEIRAKILSSMKAVAEEQGGALADPLNEDAVLLDSGLDSLGFAILVARLEEELGYDPFILMTEAVYPRTLREFVGIYEKYAPSGKA